MQEWKHFYRCDGQMCEKTDKTHFKALGEKKYISIKNASSHFKIKAIREINSFPGGTSGKEPPASAGDKRRGISSGSGKSPGGGRDNPLQCS